MSYTYSRSPSGDILRVSRCDEGHLTLVVTDGLGLHAAPICIAPGDVAEVTAEMQAWAAPDAPSAMRHPG